MIEIKIPFTKTKVNQKNDPSIPANVKVYEVEISTNFRMSQLGVDLSKVVHSPPDNTLAKLWFAFWDGAEPTLSQNLLDSSKTNFELIFNKKQVDFHVAGMTGVIDPTKSEITLYSAPESRLLDIRIKPIHASVIKLTESGQEIPPIPQPNPEGPGTPPLPPLTLI